MFVTPLQKLLAFKALALTKGLSVSERRVGAAIVDHFNRNDGRCDPGIDCLAEELAIDRRTVIRSVRKLDRLEIVFKDRYQGRHRTNSYEPNWRKLTDLLASWQLGRKRNRRKNKRTDLSLQQGQSRGSSGDSADTQICSRNLVQESVRRVNEENNSGRHSEGMLRNGQARRTLDEPHHGALQRMRSREAADQSALKRWQADLLQHDTALFQAIVVAIDDARTAAITAAEMRRHGDGLQYILEHHDQLLAQRDGDE